MVRHVYTDLYTDVNVQNVELRGKLSKTAFRLDQVTKDAHDSEVQLRKLRVR